jgi:hypothetical protein
MGNREIPGHPTEHRVETPEQSEIPAMPHIGPSEQVEATLYPLIDGVSPTIGWQFRSRAKGGPGFMIIRRSSLGSLKVVKSFPLTEDGWAAAWQSLITQDRVAAQKVVAALKAREASAIRLKVPEPVMSSPPQQADESQPYPLATLYDAVLLGGYLPDIEVFTGQRHHVMFFEDRLWLVLGSTRVPQVAIPYREIENIEIGGPGIVRTGGGFTGGGFGVVGAIEGMGIASILNGFTSRTSIKTILGIQGTGFEFFLLHTRATPERLRIELSRPLAAIRSTRALRTAAEQGPVPGSYVSPVDELTKLADMLDKGLLTRDEFDLMKTKIMGL